MDNADADGAKETAMHSMIRLIAGQQCVQAIHMQVSKVSTATDAAFKGVKLPHASKGRTFLL